MDDSAKYLIHADFVTNGVIERSDVVGAVFGQTEGLLGDDLDLRDLKQASKVGRIDVEVDSEGGRSHGNITIATTLDKVETAILAASLETIDRVGPCRSEVSISQIEDVRAAKRREVVERAKELLVDAFDESIMDSREILEEVRGSVRVEDITDYHGLPAGPRVGSSDAIIVVEGRSDVLTLLRYGIKNAIAVEGTNVPDAVAELSQERTVTTFLDGDRGGELILRELQQVGDVDYVAFAPDGRSVEDLPRHEVMAALRNKRPVEDLQEDDFHPPAGDAPSAPSGTTDTPPANEGDGESPTDGIDPSGSVPTAGDQAEADDTADAGDSVVRDADTDSAEATTGPTLEDPAAERSTIEEPTAEASAVEQSPIEDPESEDSAPEDPTSEPDTTASTVSLREHVRDVLEDGDAAVRFLDADLRIQTETDLGGAFEELTDIDPVPFAVVYDGELSQRLLDVAAQRGVEHVVASTTGEYVKKPIGVRIRTTEELLDRAEAA